MKLNVTLNAKQLEFLTHCIEQWADGDGPATATPNFTTPNGKKVVLSGQQVEELFVTLNRGVSW